MQLIRPPREPDRRPQRHDLHAMERKMVASGAMEYADLEALIRDIEWEPEWRSEADANARYYDGYQKTSEQKRLELEGQPVAVVNLISRTVNTLLGNESKGRVNWKLSADSEEEFGEVSDALQVKMTQAQRETGADMAISEAYGSQTKAGIGWCEVSRIADPFSRLRYRVAPVHRNELWWDWRAKALDLQDARWMLRKQWHDLDDLEALMPQFAELFRLYGQTSFGNMSFSQAIHASDVMRQAEDVRRSFRVASEEWLDTSRKRIATYEVWYRVYKSVVALMLPDGPAVEFDPKSPIHDEALRRGMAKKIRAPMRVMRQALFVGPHRLFDDEVKRDRFPYIPFWAFRDDETRAPYSMVSGMRYPQDEYNARRSRLMWLLQAAQTVVEEDALAAKYNNLYDLAREVRRPDAMIVLNKARMRDKAIDIGRNVELPQEQVMVMQDARALIMEQPGVSEAMMGDKVPGVTAGVAFNSLVQQSNVAIGDHDDNYRYGRRLVGEALLDLIIEDHQKPRMPVKVGAGSHQRVVVLNDIDEQGNVVRNVVTDTALNVALDDSPNTPAYKMHQQMQIASLLQVAGTDPDARAVLIPAFIETTDLPNRDSDARWLRQRYGVPIPGDREGQKKAEQARAQEAAKQGQIQDAMIKAELDEKQAGTAQKASAAKLNEARVVQIGQQVQQAAQAAEADAANDEDARIESAMAKAGAPARPNPQAAQA